MLRKYESDPTHILDFEEIEVDDQMTYLEKLVRIEDRKKQVLQNKTMSLVKVIWQHHGMEEVTWESEELMKLQYPHLFED